MPRRAVEDGSVILEVVEQAPGGIDDSLGGEETHHVQRMLLQKSRVAKVREQRGRGGREGGHGGYGEGYRGGKRRTSHGGKIVSSQPDRVPVLQNVGCTHVLTVRRMFAHQVRAESIRRSRSFASAVAVGFLHFRQQTLRPHPTDQACYTAGGSVPRESSIASLHARLLHASSVALKDKNDRGNTIKAKAEPKKKMEGAIKEKKVMTDEDKEKRKKEAKGREAKKQATRKDQLAKNKGVATKKKSGLAGAAVGSLQDDEDMDMSTEEGAFDVPDEPSEETASPPGTAATPPGKKK